MKKQMCLFASILFCLSLVVNADAQIRKQIGKTGDWVNTIAGVTLQNQIYTVESSGALYETNPATGIWKQLGKKDFANTLFLMAASGKLFSIEKDGSLYAISPVDASWKQVGTSGGWANTIAATALDDRLYTVESSGALYETNPATGIWKQLGGSEFSATRFLFGCSDALCALEKNGSLFSVVAKQGGPSAPARVEEQSGAALAGDLTFHFLGKWIGDTSTFEKDPDFQKVAAASPDMAKSLLGVLQSCTMTVTLDGITTEAMGEKEGPFKFSIISASGRDLVIQNEEGPKKNNKATVKFIDARHMKIAEEGNEAKAMFFKKQ